MEQEIFRDELIYKKNIVKFKKNKSLNKNLNK